MPLVTEGLPTPLERIHIMGVCGTAMGSIAGMLKDAGYEVRGSDTGVYPPMSDYLAELEIPIMEGFVASNLAWGPELVVVGNVIRAIYEEAAALTAGELPYCSFPHVLGELFLKDAHSIVVSGTHGKTTTTAIAAWLADSAGANPGYLVGGIVQGWDRTARAGGGSLFVIEGDEYDTAFFDKQPKFVHYRANTAILTSVEFDHADIYADLDAIKASFKRLVQGLPSDGCLVARWDHPNVREVSADCPCAIRRYGPGQEWDGEVKSVDPETGKMTFTVLLEGKPFGTFTSSLVGEHNLYNQVAAVAALNFYGLKPVQLSEGFESFEGIKRRQQIRGTVAGITVLDDFAHHPTAVEVTTAALKMRFAGRRLWIVFEPRSNTSRRKVFQQRYAESFAGADQIILKATPDLRIEESERMDPEQLAADLRAKGHEAICLAETDDVIANLAANAMEGDVIAFFSNGAFDNVHERTLDALRARFDVQ